jgi:ABC-type sugar transport system ATPase subunit
MSGGNQQKVVLAKWLATNPKVLILDEPTNGVDIGAKSAIYEIIKEFSKRDIAILLISSEEAEIYNNCHRILLMRNGRISSEITTDKVSEEELMGYVG